MAWASRHGVGSSHELCDPATKGARSAASAPCDLGSPGPGGAAGRRDAGTRRRALAGEAALPPMTASSGSIPRGASSPWIQSVPSPRWWRWGQVGFSPWVSEKKSKMRFGTGSLRSTPASPTRSCSPGFIEPHLHPSLGAIILPLHIVSAMEWLTRRGRTRAVRGREAFMARLRELDAEGEPGEWLLVWGYHRPYHGELSRADLDRVSQSRPIMVWQRSVHEMYFNTLALETLGLEEADFAAQPQAAGRPGTSGRRVSSPSART